MSAECSISAPCRATSAAGISHDKQITVRYRFQSEFETYAEVLEQCRNM